MNTANWSDRMAVGLGIVPTNPSLLDVAGGIQAPNIPYTATPIYIGTDEQFAKMFWPDYRVTRQNDSPAGYTPVGGDSGIFQQATNWAENNSVVIYTAVGALALFAAIDALS